ncbi:TetR/AcrR family transcriptional regulator [Methanobacterium petrolearium]|uniref:TetR/AcrR family transcriptional regulator n=1 Tax=Methanobacterium petrolearium TaxID=710190 RepID=UPI001AE986BB|nr:TetR/AcrR family transcriptional regulator [Methanobacterium petrolearium]MBP1946234.1 AcrR family transcriptional regulator [Methanobacterium petrolearium]BDZ71317.1 hypothetical protein GCM10025861_18340 [Methanobacterium petrolearium]
MGKFIKKTRKERVEEILSVATEVFLEKGYQNTTMEDIINSTTLSVGGFYYYFHSTKEIFFAIIEQKGMEQIEFMHDLETEGKNKNEIIEEISAKLAEMVLEQYDERTLYFMAVSEIINDAEFRGILDRINEKSLDKLNEFILEKLPDVDAKMLKCRLEFIISVIHAMSFYCHIYNEEDLYNENLSNIKNMVVRAFSGI